ncbi:hypothetical protein NG799_20650 [Laspinema sp. D1]|uniref:Uncharacterized protein n=1 Tax=Laspinema palackyanum D2a TaxID=2953684 RepID=A0ABT2MZ28_9CYAN|nr:hypothetical protein [Laspinema sp. D2a]
MRLTQQDYTTFSLGLRKLGTHLGGLEFYSLKRGVGGGDRVALGDRNSAIACGSRH